MDKLLKNEIGRLAIVLALLIIIFKIVFYKQDIFSTTRTAIALFWMLILPGYALLYYWKDKLEFMERIVIGAAVGAAVTAILGYYLGLVGLHLKFQTIVLPVLMLLVAFAVIKKTKVIIK
ncbi:hypothetical protein IIC68_03980 [archaeon]|nr:hypothetical protein [archaeon]